MKATQRILLMAGLLAASTASAVIFIDTVLVGDPGNAADSTTTYGSVGYAYHIGTYEVTNTQYTAFLNATAADDTHSLYDTDMGGGGVGGISRAGSSGSYTYSVNPGFENKPVNYVSFWDAARFTNWLSTGNTETGVYMLTADGITNNTITRDATAWANGGVAIASENEWYKAAYYDPTLNSNAGGYWLYPTQSDSIPTRESPPGDANSANFSEGLNTVTDVGAYTGSASHYGTFDQGGNVWEWNDEISFTTNRGLRGGSFADEFFFTFDGSTLQSSGGRNRPPSIGGFDVGFRVSSLAPVPEPSTYAVMFGGLGLLMALMRRKGREAPELFLP